jgi:predicted DNA-binding protein (UPF0251 family)
MSPRPKKIRKCQGQFCGKSFKPTGTALAYLKQIPLHHDELEALRLCDKEGLTQEEGGKHGVSVHYSAYYHYSQAKTAEVLTGGHALVFVDEVDNV